MLFDGRKLAVWAALALVLAAVGCGGGSGGGDVGGSSSGGGSGSGGSSGGASSSGGATGPTAYGTLALSVVPPTDAAAGYTSLSGKLYDGPSPETVTWTKVATAGDCALYTPSTPLCTPACGSAACVATNTCMAYPATLSAGTLTLTGVGSSALAVSPISGSYSRSTTEYPPFAEGATVKVDAAGSASGAGPFTLAVKGIAPLVLTGSAGAIARAAPGYGALALRWTAPGDASLGKILVKVDLSHHGGTKGKILCEAADTGSLAVPESLVTALIGLGVYTYPSVEVTRRASASVAAGAGTITLQIDSIRSLPITIEGLTCTANADCASGACDLDPASVRYGLCK